MSVKISPLGQRCFAPGPHHWLVNVASVAAFSAVLALLPGTVSASPEQPGTARVLRIMTASTAGNTGIIRALAGAFAAKHAGVGIEVRSAGTVQVLDLAREGRADLVISHHPGSEELFVAQGYGRLRTLIMYNECAIFGPPSDPLGLARETGPIAVMKRLAREEVPFMVPGRRSGTQEKLDELWLAAGIEPNWLGYEVTKESAARTLVNASLFGAYTFADLGTYLINREELAGRIAPLFRDHMTLRNNYYAIVVDRKRIPQANEPLAEAFLEYLVSDEGQQEIAHFSEKKFGTQVFTPAAYLDKGLKARRAARALETQTSHLRRVTFLAALLGLLSLTAIWLFVRSRKLESISRSNEQRFAFAVSGTNDGIWDWNRQTDVAYVSPRVFEILGYTEQSTTLPDPVHAWEERIHPEEREEVCGQLRQYLAGKEPALFVSEHRLRMANNEYRWVQIRGKAVRNAFGAAIRMAGSLTDIADRKEQEAALEHQALHDALTGLPNRMLLLDRLQQAILAAERGGHVAALIVMDLDRFREINDTLGHQIGDLVLKQVGMRLQRALRRSDSVARLGGDEFAVLLPHADETYAKHVGQKILLLLDRVFELGHHSLHIGGSLGIALYPDHGEDAETLLKRADVAMYTAKRSNTGCALYDESHDHGSGQRLRLANELHDALESNVLELYYQPIVHLPSAKIVGVESLLRWQHPQRGWIPPNEMIPIAEHSGLIKPLSMWVLDYALDQCVKWRQSGIQLKVAVNLSVWNLHDPNLIDEIAQKLAARALPASQLELEITESTTMADPERFSELLGQLHEMGIRLAIDDFGTGFSSLGYLKKLPVDVIKIDKSFVIDMDHDQDSATIVRSTIDLAHNLGLKVVAEGVESADILSRLATLGCDVVQGYYLGRPMPELQLRRWLSDSPWGLQAMRPKRAAE